MGKSETVTIPDRPFFRIGEVSELTHTEAYVLRYWETEFPMLAPEKSSSGQRLYRRKDIEMVFEIKRLLHEQGFTIEGARKQLMKNLEAETAEAAPAARTSLERSVLLHLRDQLRELLDILNGRPRSR